MPSKLSAAARIARSIVLVVVGLGLIVYAAQDTLVMIQEHFALPIPILPALKAFGMAQDYGFVPFAEPLEEGEDHFAPTLEAVAGIQAAETSTPFQVSATDTKTPNSAPPDQSGVSTPEPEPTPTLTPEPTERVRALAPDVPVRLVIPSISLDAPIIESIEHYVVTDGVTYNSWSAPNQPSVGWHKTSARLAEIGNTVLNGHHNVYGKVFANLHKVQPGDEVLVFSEDYSITYVVSNVMILPERDAGIEARIENARWIQPSTDERLTLVTCWPEISNTHRLIVVAQPIDWNEQGVDDGKAAAQ